MNRHRGTWIVEPEAVELSLDLEGAGVPDLPFVERYPADKSASSVAALYRELPALTATLTSRSATRRRPSSPKTTGKYESRPRSPSACSSRPAAQTSCARRWRWPWRTRRVRGSTTPMTADAQLEDQAHGRRRARFNRKLRLRRGPCANGARTLSSSLSDGHAGRPKKRVPDSTATAVLLSRGRRRNREHTRRWTP